MTAVTQLLERMRATRQTVQERIQSVTEEQMLASTEWGQREVTVRFMFYRLIAHEVEHTVHLLKTLQVLGINQGEAGLILKQLQATRGELEGLLIGISDEELDRVAAKGEWSLRQVIEHMVDTEERYSKRIEEAVGAMQANR